MLSPLQGRGQNTRFTIYDIRLKQVRGHEMSDSTTAPVNLDLYALAGIDSQSNRLEKDQSKSILMYIETSGPDLISEHCIRATSG